MPLLEVDDLRTYFHTRDGVVRAVDGMSYALGQGETLGIVGESGSGKSVSCYALLGLLPRTTGRIEGGTARFGEQDLLRCSTRELRRIRGKRISMIFQDPMTALNPYHTIGAQLIEPLVRHDRVSRREAKQRALDILTAVGIQDAERRLHAYPHQFSGGMRQRVMIAMALITRPELLIADEPTTALDVTVQAQILELIKQMQRELGMAVLLITHDMGVVAGTCERVLVMYAGRIVESAPATELFARPRHPYTEALLQSLPAANTTPGQPLRTIPGLPPDLTQNFAGCPFAPRCSYVQDYCRSTPVSLKPLTPAHASACLRVQRGEIE